jgi:hypothetical protein
VESFELYNLASDPREQQDVSEENPQLVSEMLDWAREWYKNSRGFAAEAQQLGDLDEATARRLEQLGYVDQDHKEPNSDE